MNERIIHIQSILKQEINQMKEAEIRKLRAELNQLKGSPDNE